MSSLKERIEETLEQNRLLKRLVAAAESERFAERLSENRIWLIYRDRSGQWALRYWRKKGEAPKDVSAETALDALRMIEAWEKEEAKP